MTPEITNYECNKRNLNDGSEGAETMNKSNLFQVLIVLGTNEYIYELVREKGTHRVRECEWYERVLQNLYNMSKQLF